MKMNVVAAGLVFAVSCPAADVGVRRRFARTFTGTCNLGDDQRRKHADDHHDQHQFRQREAAR